MNSPPFRPGIRFNRTMETVDCAECGGGRSTTLFSKWGFNIVKCQNCGLCYVNPRVVSIESDHYFRGPYLANLEDSDGTLKTEIEHIYSGILRHLNSYLNPGRLLDVGCALGHFMARACQHGWNCQGIECSQYAASYGRQRWDLRIRSLCDLRDARLPDNHFDACVMIEVLEHLPQPRVTIAEVYRLLKPGGMLYLTVPNFASFRSILERENWSAVIPTGHLYYFTADSLAKMLTAVGFERLVNLTAPALFDTQLEESRTSERLALKPEALDSVRAQCASEDALKLLNARAEGLVMCAFKPRMRYSAIEATLRFPQLSPLLEGQLVSAPGESPEQQKVYLIHEGSKHWVTSVDWLVKHRMTLEQTIQVDSELLESILTGVPLA